MSEVADRFVAVLDANVLYPFRVRDALLRFAEAGLYRARWSDQIITEWRNSLLRKRPELGASIDSQIAAMNAAFPEATISGHDVLVPTLTLPDPDDRHVLAAAIKADAQVIVTENLDDFPEEVLKPFGMEALQADVFLANTFELYQSQALSALRTMRKCYRNPPMNPGQFLTDLMRAGLVQTAALARKDVDIL